MSIVDLIIVGAGPAGMSAAIAARRAGLDVLVVDDQPAPGGQIWRGVESATAQAQADVLGADYMKGASVVRAFRQSGASYEPQTQVWQIEPDLHVMMSRAGTVRAVRARAVLLAVGAQERPVPFPGWTLPGVMTVGAAQILLKTSAQVPAEPVWIAGNGPLPLLYAAQLIKAGGRIAGILDTTPPVPYADAFFKLAPAMASGARDLLKGLRWLAARARLRVVRRVSRIEAFGTDALEGVRYATSGGAEGSVAARVLLVHEGLVPSIHPTLALRCGHQWHADQSCFGPVVDEWGETTLPNLFVAGDGRRIGGAAVACLAGELAGLRIAQRLGRLDDDALVARARRPRRELAKALALRPFLDTVYRPRPETLMPPDNTIACRCEEVSVAAIRAQAIGGQGPNQVKASTRAGMGPCQGRQCAYTIANILARCEGRDVADLGLFRARPPFRPVTLGELASLDESRVAEREQV